MTVESPCIKICTLDAAGELCLGCFRSLDEIGLWSQLADTERARVLQRLPERRRQFESARSPLTTARFCERCGAEFSCGAKDPTQPCWCTRYPPVAPSAGNASCLCPACLAAAAK